MHHQVGEGVGKIVDGAGSAAVGHAVEHVENQRAGNTGDGGHEGEGHAADQLGDTVHGFGGVRHIQPAQAAHQADKGTQNVPQQILERTPPELGADIYKHGIYLSGGAAGVDGLSELMEEQTGLSVNLYEEPMACVIKGISQIIKNDKYNSLAYSIDNN